MRESLQKQENMFWQASAARPGMLILLPSSIYSIFQRVSNISGSVKISIHFPKIYKKYSLKKKSQKKKSLEGFRSKFGLVYCWHSCSSKTVQHVRHGHVFEPSNWVSSVFQLIKRAKESLQIYKKNQGKKSPEKPEEQEELEDGFHIHVSQENRTMAHGVVLILNPNCRC